MKRQSTCRCRSCVGDSGTVAEVIYEFGVIRGDLREASARVALEARIRAIIARETDP